MVLPNPYTEAPESTQDEPVGYYNNGSVSEPIPSDDNDNQNASRSDCPSYIGEVSYDSDMDNVQSTLNNESKRPSESPVEDPTRLKSTGTNCLQTTWKDYESSVGSPDSTRFDFIISQHPLGPISSYI